MTDFLTTLREFLESDELDEDDRRALKVIRHERVERDQWNKGDPSGYYGDCWCRNDRHDGNKHRITTIELWKEYQEDTSKVNKKLYLVIWFEGFTEERIKYYKFLSDYSTEKRDDYIKKINDNEIKWLEEPYPEDLEIAGQSNKEVVPF